MSFKLYENESIPASYSADEERKIIALLATCDAESARYDLIVHNLRLVVYIASRFSFDPSGDEDIISVGIIGLIKAVDTFDPGKNVRLCTYAARCIENEILAYMRNRLKASGEISLEEIYDIECDAGRRYHPGLLTDGVDQIGERIEEDNEKSSLREALNGLDKRERDFIDMRFGLRDESGSYMTQTEIAKLMGVSQAYLSKFEKKVIKHLREEIAAINAS